jgi:5-(carboxyamino)imidazole ribonucleotide synthase
LCGLLPGRTDLLSAVVMANLLGDLWPQTPGEPHWDVLMEAPNAHLHLYGKQHARPGRKMGHFSVLAASAGQALDQTLALRDTL